MQNQLLRPLLSPVFPFIPTTRIAWALPSWRVDGLRERRGRGEIRQIPSTPSLQLRPVRQQVCINGWDFSRHFYTPAVVDTRFRGVVPRPTVKVWGWGRVASTETSGNADTFTACKGLLRLASPASLMPSSCSTTAATLRRLTAAFTSLCSVRPHASQS